MWSRNVGWTRSRLVLKRMYYNGPPFRIRSLSAVEVDEKLKKRGITPSSFFNARKDVYDSVTKDLELGKLTNEDAVDLMSYQDLMDHLKARNLSTSGPGKTLRATLIQVMDTEEKEGVSTPVIPEFAVFTAPNSVPDMPPDSSVTGNPLHKVRMLIFMGRRLFNGTL